MIRFRAVERPTERREFVVRQVVRLEARLTAAAVPCTGWSPRAAVRALPRASSSTTTPPASGSLFPARVAERSSNQLRTSFAVTASTRRLPKVGSMCRRTPSACARRVAGFERSAQSARNAGANVRTVGTVAGAPFVWASANIARAACRASLHRQRVEPTECPLDDGAVVPPMHDPRLAARSRAPAVRGPVLRCPIITAPRPFSGREGARARHGDLRFVRHVPIPPVRFGRYRRGAGAPSLGNTQDTPGNACRGSKIGGIGIAALKRRAGCKPLCLRGFRRLADGWEDCDFSTPEAR